MSATGIARDKQQNRTKQVTSTEVTTINGYSRAVIHFDDESVLYCYGSDEQTRLV
jgi:hypothetical protein